MSILPFAWRLFNFEWYISTFVWNQCLIATSTVLPFWYLLDVNGHSFTNSTWLVNGTYFHSLWSGWKAIELVFNYLKYFTSFSCAKWFKFSPNFVDFIQLIFYAFWNYQSICLKFVSYFLALPHAGAIKCAFPILSQLSNFLKSVSVARLSDKLSKLKFHNFI